jgi:hypothetical protein
MENDTYVSRAPYVWEPACVTKHVFRSVSSCSPDIDLIQEHVDDGLDSWKRFRNSSQQGAAWRAGR